MEPACPVCCADHQADREEERAHARDLERRLARISESAAFDAGCKTGRRQFQRECVNAFLVGLALGAAFTIIDALAASLFDS